MWGGTLVGRLTPLNFPPRRRGALAARRARDCGHARRQVFVVVAGGLISGNGWRLVGCCMLWRWHIPTTPGIPTIDLLLPVLDWLANRHLFHARDRSLLHPLLLCDKSPSPFAIWTLNLRRQGRQRGRCDEDDVVVRFFPCTIFFLCSLSGAISSVCPLNSWRCSMDAKIRINRCFGRLWIWSWFVLFRWNRTREDGRRFGYCAEYLNWSHAGVLCNLWIGWNVLCWSDQGLKLIPSCVWTVVVHYEWWKFNVIAGSLRWENFLEILFFRISFVTVGLWLEFTSKIYCLAKN